MISPDESMKLSPKTVTGVLHAQNKGACDW